MKKSILNAIAAMLAVLMFAAPVTALTEGEESAPAVEVKQEVKEQKSEEKAETKAEEKAETKTEEKVEEKAEEKVEEKAAEQAETAEQTEVESEDKVEATEEAPAEEAEAEDEAEIEDYETPLGSSDEEDLTISVKEAFKGRVRVELKENLPIYYGDEVTMQAIVTKANMSCKVLWQTYDAINREWKTVHTGDEYAITVTKENADENYHVVLEVKGEECVTVAYRLPEASERPVEAEEPAEEQPAEEQPAEEQPADEQPADEQPADEEPAEEAPVEEQPDEEISTKIASDDEAEAEPKNQPVVIDQKIDDEPVATNTEASVRLEADGLSEIFATLPEGTEIKVLGIDGDWVMVEIDGQVGYIYKDEIDGIDFEALQPEVPADEEQDPEANMKVTIFTSRRTAMKVGETVYLTSKLEGFDGYELKYQWECDKGAGFEPVSGANGDSWSFEASAESLGWYWRLSVYYR